MATHDDTSLAGGASAHRREKRTEFIAVRVTPTVKDRLAAVAEQRQRTLSWLVNTQIEQFLNGRDADQQRE